MTKRNHGHDFSVLYAAEGNGMACSKCGYRIVVSDDTALVPVQGARQRDQTTTYVWPSIQDFDAIPEAYKDALPRCTVKDPA